jgi:SPOR domain
MNVLLQYSRLCLLIATSVFLSTGCVLQQGDTRKQPSAAGLIATSPSHYSTQKARHLGEKYKHNLDRLIEKIIANPKTAHLQFANNIESAGGMGFFTHSAVKSPDERFLEIVLGTGESLELKGDYSAKVARLFSIYGKELLLILVSDVSVYNDRELSGYGLNFTWRTLGPRVGTERVIVYFPKEKVRAFLKQDLSANNLLANAVIFATEQEGKVNLVSFHAQEPTPDARAPIHEEILLPELAKPNLDTKLLPNAQANSEQGAKPRPNGQETSGWERKKERTAIQSGASAKLKDPAVSGPTKEEIAPGQKVEAAVAGKTQPVASDSNGHLAVKTNKTPMPSAGVTKITPTPDGPKSVEPVIETRTIQPMIQPEINPENATESTKSVEKPKEKEEIEFRQRMIDSQRLLGQSGAKEDSVPDLTIEEAPALAPTQMLPSSSKELRPHSDVEKPAELASIPKVSPKPANMHPPSSIIGSNLEATQAAPVKRGPALVRDKRIESLPENGSFVRPIPKALEGYIIQVAFNDRAEARRWADTFEERGYAVSTTEAGTRESLRVRIGNFRFRDDAERQLKTIREDGLQGIVLNLPQAYRPEVRSSLP